MASISQQLVQPFGNAFMIDISVLLGYIKQIYKIATKKSAYFFSFLGFLLSVQMNT